MSSLDEHVEHALTLVDCAPQPVLHTLKTRISVSIRQWRDAQRRGTLVAEEATFMAVRVVPELPMAAPPAEPTASSCSADSPVERDERIEIVLPDGAAVRVSETVGSAALRRVLSALRG